MLIGYGLFFWAQGANAYFADGVRIQFERGHRVGNQGPNRYIRHPAYSRAILAIFAAPLPLGALWAVIPYVCM